MALSINTPYTSIAEADLTLGLAEPWFSSSNNQKTRALEIGRAYIDTKYSCVEIDESDVPDPIKIANAELANIYLSNPTAFFGNTTTKGIKRTRVVAGSVESEKEYDAYASIPVDLYPEITAIISEYCSRTGSMTFVTR